MHKIKIDQFEGPLDLLLQLIEQQKLDIAEVSLAQVTEQYIQCLHEAKDQISLDELADFLVVAAKLLLIKSRVLLPYLHVKEEEEQDLEAQLKIYKQFHEASKIIQKIISKHQFSFSRPHLLVGKDIGFRPPKNLTVQRLTKAFVRVLDKIEQQPFVRLPKDVIKKTINISEKIEQLKNQIFKEATMNFQKIISQAKDKTEVIVSFLALLELVKQKAITVEQGSIFDDITIRRLEKDS
jgi:segregation and condensation protein A